MPEEVRLWKITASDSLQLCPRSDLDLESRIESWTAKDISILSPDLLVIGEQVQTGLRGIIDLLCMDSEGDLVIVELKRAKTPREVTAQALDYASWVKDLNSEEVAAIAAKHLGKGLPLEQAFKSKFGKPLPESINENHRMLIVASKIDPSSERIIRYLSDTYGVDINAATFHYFKTPDGGELLARLFLIEPDEVGGNDRVPPVTKRRPPLTIEQLGSIASSNGVGDLYQEIVSAFEAQFSRRTTLSSIAFIADIDGSKNAFFSLIPPESDSSKGLAYQIYSHRLEKVMGVTPERLRAMLPPDPQNWIYYPNASKDYEGYTGFFRTKDDVGNFLNGLGWNRETESWGASR